MGCHLEELGVLIHHGGHNPQEGLIGGEQTPPTSQGVPLHPPLARVLAQHLQHTATIVFLDEGVVVCNGPLVAAVSHLHNPITTETCGFVATRKPPGNLGNQYNK